MPFTATQTAKTALIGGDMVMCIYPGHSRPAEMETLVSGREDAK